MKQGRCKSVSNELTTTETGCWLHWWGKGWSLSSLLCSHCYCCKFSSPWHPGDHIPLSVLTRFWGLCGWGEWVLQGRCWPASGALAIALGAERKRKRGNLCSGKCHPQDCLCSCSSQITAVQSKSSSLLGGFWLSRQVVVGQKWGTGRWLRSARGKGCVLLCVATPAVVWATDNHLIFGNSGRTSNQFVGSLWRRGK